MVGAFDDYDSLRELLTAASAGDGRAIDELMTHYNPTVRRDALAELRRQGCNLIADHSPDIINDAWFAIIVNGNRLENCESFDGWVYKIVSNLVSKHASGPNGCISLQNNTVQFEPPQDARSERPGKQPVKSPRIERTYKKIEAALLVNEWVDMAYEMDFMFGEIVRLHLIEGYTLKETAAKLDQPYTKLRNFYYRHLDEFRKSIRDGSEDDNNEDEDDDNEDDDGDGDDGGSPYAH